MTCVGGVVSLLYRHLILAVTNGRSAGWVCGLDGEKLVVSVSYYGKIVVPPLVDAHHPLPESLYLFCVKCRAKNPHNHVVLPPETRVRRPHDEFMNAMGHSGERL